MSKSIPEQSSKPEDSDLIIPDSVLNQLQREAEHRDAELNDLLNDYIMLNPELTLAVIDQR